MFASQHAVVVAIRQPFRLSESTWDAKAGSDGQAVFCLFSSAFQFASRL
jgi:hypothetical protein